MLSIEQCRNILGDAATSLNDEQIRDLRDTCDALAAILADSYLHHLESEHLWEESEGRQENVDINSRKSILRTKKSNQH